MEDEAYEAYEVYKAYEVYEVDEVSKSEADEVNEDVELEEREAIRVGPSRHPPVDEVLDEVRILLLDVGCEHTVIGLDNIQDIQTKPSRRGTVTVDRVSLPVVGQSCVTFRIETHLMVFEVDVSAGVM